MKQYIIETENIPTTQTEIRSDCNAITFINQGTADVLINNFTLQAGATLEIAGNEDEIDVTKYRISWGAASGPVYVLRKLFRPETIIPGKR